MTPVLETRGLGKMYGRVTGVEDLSLQVAEREVFGFLGPNGAGKTTTIRLMLGLLKPTSGSFTRPRRERVGYLPGELALWPDLSGRETLDILARLSGREPQWRARLLDQLTLTPAELRRPTRTWSDGMKQKLGIIQALQCAPALALLDEPTKGLDPLMQQAFYDVLDEARAAGTTVFLSSHVLSEVERVCDRVAILRSGRLVKVASIDELRATQRRRVTVTFREPVVAASIAPGAAIEESSPRRLVLLIPQPELPALLLRLSVAPVEDLQVAVPSLEDTFLEHYREAAS